MEKHQAVTRSRNVGNVAAEKARLEQVEASFLIEQRKVEREVRERTLAYETHRKEIARRHLRRAAGERSRSARSDPRRAAEGELIELMQHELAFHVPGQSYLFTQPIQLRFNEIMAGARADTSVKIYGDEFEELERRATESRHLLRTIRGAGAEAQRPLATVVIGGILTSTFLTLVLLPTLHPWIEGKQQPVTGTKGTEIGRQQSHGGEATSNHAGATAPTLCPQSSGLRP